MSQSKFLALDAPDSILQPRDENELCRCIILHDFHCNPLVQVSAVYTGNSLQAKELTTPG